LLPGQLGDELPVVELAAADGLGPAAELAQRCVRLSGGPLQSRQAHRALNARAIPSHQLRARGDRSVEVAPALVKRCELLPAAIVGRAQRSFLEQGGRLAR